MLDIRMLGAFEIHLDGEPVKLPTRTAASLLAYLALNPDISHRRDKSAGILWPELDEVKSRNNLRHTLWRLRNTVGEKYFNVDKSTIQLITSSDYPLDVDRLKIQADETATIESLMIKASAYKGELQPGFYDEWVTLERERLHLIFLLRTSTSCFHYPLPAATHQITPRLSYSFTYLFRNIDHFGGYVRPRSNDANVFFAHNAFSSRYIHNLCQFYKIIIALPNQVKQ